MKWRRKAGVTSARLAMARNDGPGLDITGVPT
jgi:hypothetical protein